MLKKISKKTKIIAAVLLVMLVSIGLIYLLLVMNFVSDIRRDMTAFDKTQIQPQKKVSEPRVKAKPLAPVKPINSKTPVPNVKHAQVQKKGLEPKVNAKAVASGTPKINLKPQTPGVPTRLRIPALNIDTTIESVGLTSSGSMGVPKKPDNVGWFALGVTPGEIGSSVIDGHYGSIRGHTLVFNFLDRLQPGDKILVEDDKNNVVTFIVRYSKNFLVESDTSAVFNSNDGKAHLNLITCQGSWNKLARNYSGRLVIFADMELNKITTQN
jgi:sortase (surface protein transpeptidase)